MGSRSFIDPIFCDLLFAYSIPSGLNGCPKFWYSWHWNFEHGDFNCLDIGITLDFYGINVENYLEKKKLLAESGTCMCKTLLAWIIVR